MDPKHERAVTMLAAVWRGIDSDRKSRYAYSIWKEFENSVKASAYASSLPKFVNTLASKWQASIRDTDVHAFNQAMSAGDDAAMLRTLREETTYLTLLVREQNDERRERFQQQRTKETA